MNQFTTSTPDAVVHPEPLHVVGPSILMETEPMSTSITLDPNPARELTALLTVRGTTLDQLLSYAWDYHGGDPESALDELIQSVIRDVVEDAA